MVATVPVAFTAFMTPHIRELSRDYDITLVTTNAESALTALRHRGVTLISLTIPRDIALLADCKALLALWRLFRQQRFDLVQSLTPKGGLLTMLAARLAGVPRRVHWYTGQVWATRHGLFRWLLKKMDRVTALCATQVLADSPSQAAFLRDEGVARGHEVIVFGQGSVCGVDTQRFRPDPDARRRVRRELGIGDDAVVALFLGRLNVDKGLPELAAAFADAARECPALYLVLVGTDEGGMQASLTPVLAPVVDRVRFLDHTAAPETFMAAADVFVLPSHREGFGATVIEAAACEVPTIGTRIYGLTDAVDDGVTGVLVPVADAESLRVALVSLTIDSERRRRMGTDARRRVEQSFSQAQMTAALTAFYDRLLGPAAGPR